MKTWFTADTHFGHASIIRYCDRPFRNVDVMNKTLIRNWNSRVQPNDVVIFVGDFAFREKANVSKYLDQLNGHITFIKGNHDHNNSLNSRILSLVVEFPNKDLVYCVHDPADFSNSYRINIVGHVHKKWRVKKVFNTFLVNVGVDVWNYAPVEINQILKVIEGEIY